MGEWNPVACLSGSWHHVQPSALSSPWSWWLCHTADTQDSLFPLDPVTSGPFLSYQALQKSRRNSG